MTHEKRSTYIKETNQNKKPRQIAAFSSDLQTNNRPIHTKETNVNTKTKHKSSSSEFIDYKKKRDIASRNDNDLRVKNISVVGMDGCVYVECFRNFKNQTKARYNDSGVLAYWWFLGS